MWLGMVRVKSYCTVPLFFILIVHLGFARSPQEKFETESLNRIFFGEPHQTLMNINNFSFWLREDGWSGRNPFNGDAGGIYPRGTANVIYQDGILWGGYIHDGSIFPPLRVGGQMYRIGTSAGRIISLGVAQDPSNPAVRIYRIRRDWHTVSDSVLRLDASELNDIDLSQVNQGQIEAVRMQYGRDWQEWPISYGAPFIDLNGNGIYDPQEGEEPGFQDADQVVWFVCNDLDPGATNSLFGSAPMGIEIQVTFWGYDVPGPLGETLFRRYRLINKSGFTMDSLFIALWSDPDMGSYHDDYAGCDSVLNAVFGYNSRDFDHTFYQFGLPPAAVGYVLLKGPSLSLKFVSKGRFFNDINSQRNLGMTSFAYLVPSSINGNELGDYDETLGVYNMLNGYQLTADTLNPSPYTHGFGRFKGNVTKYPLNGDPVLLTGDIDGMGDNYPAGDRRFIMSSGPFTFQPGDTQEVIYALIGGIDPLGDHLSSLSRLKSNMKAVRTFFNTGLPAPHTAYRISEISNRQIDCSFQVNLLNSSDISASMLRLYPEIGNEMGLSLSLYDDGLHGDNLAGDNVWANQVVIDNRQYPFAGDLILTRSTGMDTIPGAYQNLRLRPAPELTNWQVKWENGKQDGHLNYRENVLLSFELANKDYVNPINSVKISSYVYPGDTRYINNNLPVQPGTAGTEPGFYIDLTAPPEGEVTSFRVGIVFDGYYVNQEYTYPLIPWSPDTLWRSAVTVEEIRGFSENVQAVVADPAALTGHDYLITFFQTGEDTLLWRIEDRNTGVVKSDSLPLLPDEGNVIHPVIDGIEYRVIKRENDFKNFVVVANAAGPVEPAEMGCIAFSDNGFPFLINNLYPAPGTDRPDRSRQQTNRSAWVFHTYMTPENDASFVYFKSLVVPDSNWDRVASDDFEMRFTVRRNFADWAFENGGCHPVPFEIWNIGLDTPDDPSDDYRMIPWIRNLQGDTGGGDTTFNLVALDHVVSGGDNDPYTDAVYWRDPLDISPGESGYNLFVAQAQAGTYQFDSPAVMDALVLVNWNGGFVSDPTFPSNVDALLPEPGTIFQIITMKLSRAGDSLLVKSPESRPDFRYDWPRSYRLFQNYPNPFNFSTVIPFELPANGKVSIEIYNILGQKVRELLNNSDYQRGWYEIRWNGYNDQGNPLASGIYICRMVAGQYMLVRKMILLK